MNELSESREQATDGASVVERLQDAGRFIAVARRIRSGEASSLAEAAKNRMTVKTFRTLAESLARVYGYEGLPLYESGRGAKGDRAKAWIKLTPAGDAVLDRLEFGAAAFFPDLPPPLPDRVRVIIEEQALLDGLVDRIAFALPDAELVRRPRGHIEETLTSSPAKLPPIALLWSGWQDRWAKKVVSQPLFPAVPLGVLCKDTERLTRPAKGVLPNRTFALGELDGPVTVAYPSGFGDAKRLLPERAVARQKESLAEVLADAISGASEYAIVPDVPDVVDPLRFGGAVSFMWLAPVDVGATSVSLATLSVHGRGHPDHAKVRAAAAGAAEAFAQGSAFDLPARDRELPTEPAAYSVPLNAWFLDPLAERPTWQREKVRFTDVSRVGPSDGPAERGTLAERAPSAPAGQHVLRLRGTLVNHREEPFVLTGGVLGTHTLYFVADSTGLIRIGTNPKPVTFVAYFPYSREYQGKRVWVGFYIGRDLLDNPLTVPMVLADGALEDLDLDTLARGLRIRPLMVPPRRPLGPSLGGQP